MKVKEFSQQDIYEVKGNHINVIYGENGIVSLPNSLKLCQLQVIFAHSGHFKIIAENSQLTIGFKDCYDYFETKPGEPNFDVQPKFLFLPRLKKWAIMALGNLIIPEPDAIVADEIEVVQ